MAKELTQTGALAAKVLFAALQVLKDKGGELPGREVFDEIEDRLELDAWAKEAYAKTGNPRWESLLHLFSIDAVKAGYLLKKNGVWYITPEGEQAMSLGEAGLLQAAKAGYHQWKSKHTDEGAESGEEEGEEGEAYSDKGATMTLQRIQEIALEGLTKFVASKDPYELQDMVAALLRGMGYFTRTSQRGKDGGVDVVAYRDPLGTQPPRMKVQVKHREQQSTAQQVRELIGVLHGNDVGVFVSTGGFTQDAKTTAQNSQAHIELVDLTRFIELWRDFYHKLTDEDKARLPLTPVYFVEPTE